MSHLLAGLLILALSCPGLSAGKDPLSRGMRQNYLLKAVEATISTPLLALKKEQRFISLLHQSTCRSELMSLKLSCMKKSAEQNCQGQTRARCKLVSDLLIVNTLNEKAFVTKREKFDTMKNYPNYREQINRTLRHRYAGLVTEMILRPKYTCSPADFSCIAREVDGFCLAKHRHQKLNYQGCAAAIIWFIGYAQR
jgi:hypothetical protein